MATWSDITRIGDGSGRLLIARSKTDRFGVGAVMYVSARTLVALDNHHELDMQWGGLRKGDNRIFGVTGATLVNDFKLVLKKCGIEGRFASHSMRVGMAQELAIAGFGLTMIMQAGRWDNPAMPAYYIRGLKASDSAVARLSRMGSEGTNPVALVDKGVDALASYNGVRQLL